MLIIIEGPEKQGKTTLAKYLAIKLGYRYLHLGAPTEGANGYALQLQEIAKAGENVVMDRSFIGELVYGPLFRGKSCVNTMQFDVLCRLANSLGAVVIYAKQPPSIAAKWFKEEKAVSNHQQRQATIRFDELMCGVVRTRLPVLEYGASTFIERNKWVADNSGFIGHRSFQYRTYRHYWLVNKGFNGYGANRPETVLVGEQLNPKATWVGMPFDGGSASEYLRETLELAGINQLDCYFLNAKQSVGFTKGAELDYLRSVGNPRFVALGNVANAFLAGKGINRISIPHPQYFKRFRSKEKHIYVDLLAEACR